MGLLGDVFGWLNSDLWSAGRWVTLKNGRRVKIDSDGRILEGLPEKYRGIRVRDLSAVTRAERELLRVDCEREAACRDCPETFRTKDEAYAAILRANPELHSLQQSEFGAYDVAFLKWQRGGRRGPKPRTRITDGRLDAINEHYDLRGANRVGSFTEAVYHAIPASRRWADLEPRLVPLQDAAGVKINLPDEALRLSVSKLDVEQCRQEIDQRHAALLEHARAGDVEAPPAADEVPF